MRLDQASHTAAAGCMADVVPSVEGAVADGRSFADWLASAGAGTGFADGGERPFSNGTMRAAAQRFDANGLLGTGTVPAPEAAEVEVPATALAGLRPTPRVVETEVGPVAAPAIGEALPSEHSASAAVRKDGTPVPAASPSIAAATHRPVPVVRGAVAMPVVAARPMRFAAIASEPTATVRRARVPAAPALQVTLTDTGDGVTVAVAGAVAREEEAGVQQAVRRLLARHGLTLGDMRFVRRVGGGREQGER